MQQPFGAGALLTTEVEHLDLGEHHGTRIRARVERRLLRLGFGDRAGFRFTLGRARPTSLQLARGQRTATLPVSVPRDPWLHTVIRLLALTTLALVLRPLAPAPGPRKLLPIDHGGPDGTK